MIKKENSIMFINLKKSLFSNAPIKAISLILGYTIWSMLSQSHTSSVWLDVPLCFYNEQNKTAKSSSESIRVHLAGSRLDLSNLDLTTLAAHINLNNYKRGRSQLTIDTKHLFLPDSVKLVHCKPSNILITVDKQTI